MSANKLLATVNKFDKHLYGNFIYLGTFQYTTIMYVFQMIENITYHVIIDMTVKILSYCTHRNIMNIQCVQ